MTSTMLSRSFQWLAASALAAGIATGVSANAWADVPIDIHHPEEVAFGNCILKDTYVNCCLQNGGTLYGDAAKPLCRLPYQEASAQHPPSQPTTKPVPTVPRVITPPVKG
jgi:hypothetical protein